MIELALPAARAVGDGGTGGIEGWLDDPSVAFVLLALGIAALMAELAHPGLIGTGVGGLVLVGLGLWSLSMQPVSTPAIGLMVIASVLFAIEIFTPSPGIAGALGGVCMFAAALLLIDGPDDVPAAVAAPIAVVVAISVIVAGRLAMRSRHLPSTLTGPERFTGRELTVARSRGTTGEAFVDGAWWQVRSTAAPLEPGMLVRIVDVDGLVLVVEPAAPATNTTGGSST